MHGIWCNMIQITGWNQTWGIRIRYSYSNVFEYNFTVFVFVFEYFSGKCKVFVFAFEYFLKYSDSEYFHEYSWIHWMPIRWINNIEFSEKWHEICHQPINVFKTIWTCFSQFVKHRQRPLINPYSKTNIPITTLVYCLTLLEQTLQDEIPINIDVVVDLQVTHFDVIVTLWTNYV